MSDRLDVLRTLLPALPLKSHALANTVLRSGLPHGPDLLALVATRGRLGASDLVADCEQWRQDGAAEIVPDHAAKFRPRAMGALASVMAGEHFRDANWSSAALLHRFAAALAPLDAQRSDFATLAVQTNLAAGEYEVVRDLAKSQFLDDDVRWLARTELLSAGACGDSYDEGVWIDTFNEPFVQSGVAPVHLRPDAEASRFNRLACDRTASPVDFAPITGSPSLSVVMAVHRPDHNFWPAVRSLLEQTHRDFELIIVGDGPTDREAEMIREVASRDPRITVIRLAENGGAYRARNVGLGAASGEFITFHDADDWSHPERLERQIAHLHQHPERMGVVTRSVRVTDELVLNVPGVSPLRQNVSSLMFRRSEVTSLLGGYDSVRKAADSEFAERMKSVFGAECLGEIHDVLMAVQLTPGSLSRADLAHRWMSRARIAYREDYRYWHQRIARGDDSPRLETDAVRRFPAPAELLGDNGEPHRGDLLYVSDWRDRVDVGPALKRTRKAVRRGLEVSIAQVVDLHQASRELPSSAEAVLQLRASGEVTYTTWDDPIDVSTVVIDGPELLSFPWSAKRLRVTTNQVVLLATKPPRTVTSRGLRYDPAAVEQHAKEMFGMDAIWWPASAEVAAVLLEHGARAEIRPAEAVRRRRFRRRTTPTTQGDPFDRIPDLVRSAV